MALQGDLGNFMNGERKRQMADKFHFLNVGCADCTVMHLGSKVVMVDCPTYAESISIALAETEILLDVPIALTVLPELVRPVPAVSKNVPAACIPFSASVWFSQ